MLAMLKKANAIIYGMGSLCTSIGPSLALKGVGEIIASFKVPKLILMNGSYDRETQYSELNKRVHKMSASEIVQNMADFLNRRYSRPISNGYALDRLTYSIECFFTAILYPHGSNIYIDINALKDLGILTIVEVASLKDEDGCILYEPNALIDALQKIINEQKNMYS